MNRALSPSAPCRWLFPLLLACVLLPVSGERGLAAAPTRTALGDSGYSVVVPAGWTAVPGSGQGQALLSVTAPGGTLALNFNRIVIPPPRSADEATLAQLIDGIEQGFLSSPYGFQRVDDRHQVLGTVKTRIRTIVSRQNRTMVLLIFSAWGNDVIVGQLTAHETATPLVETAGACYGTLAPNGAPPAPPSATNVVPSAPPPPPPPPPGYTPSSR